MSDFRQERLAHNEVVFRTINENIADFSAHLGGGSPLHEFVCECANVDCFERIVLTIEEYEAVRAEGTRFLLKPGHEDMEIELVVETHGEYLVVEKDGVAGLLAEAEDPRG